MRNFDRTEVVGIAEEDRHQGLGNNQDGPAGQAGKPMLKKVSEWTDALTILEKDVPDGCRNEVVGRTEQAVAARKPAADHKAERQED